MIPLWWDVLKNAKLSGRAKGSTLDTNRININIDKDCCVKLWSELQGLVKKHSTVFNVFEMIEGAGFITGHHTDYAAGGDYSWSEWLNKDNDCEMIASVMGVFEINREIYSDGPIQWPFDDSRLHHGEPIWTNKTRHADGKKMTPAILKDWERLVSLAKTDLDSFRDKVIKCEDAFIPYKKMRQGLW